MNYLAHLALSQPTVASRVGNLLGDFMAGVDSGRLPAPVWRGLQNHRLVDRFTDQHAAVRDCRRQFSAQRRRFAGVALDVLFDHFLIRHWGRFHCGAVEMAMDDYLRSLHAGEALMPPAMAATVQRLISQQWLAIYAELDGVGRVLDRLAERIRFSNAFAGAVEELDDHYSEFESVFLGFYGQLQDYVARQAVEGGISGVTSRSGRY